MKFSKFNKVILFALFISIASLGCRTKGNYLTKLPPGQTGQTGANTTTPTVATPGNGLSDAGDKINSSNVDGGTIGGLSDPDKRKDWPRDREIFKTDTVHFEYDSSVVKSDEKSKLAAVADYLKANTLDAVEIEGHCDQRGTEEYNRALGERRALALREELVHLGVDASRVDTISYGEDRPADPGHNEAAYKKNRRGEFILEKHQTLVGLK